MAFVTSGALTVRASAAKQAVSRRTVSMSAGKPSAAARLAGAVAPLAIAAPALAAEGTGDALGVDNALLLVPLVLIPSVFFVLFLQFGGTQDNEDFLGEFDQRRK